MGQCHHIYGFFRGGGGGESVGFRVFLCELQFASVKLHILKVKVLKKLKLYFSRS